MARATETYTVTDDGRDRGKVFLLTELPASKAEAWATRALLALMAGGVELPNGVEHMSMAGMAEAGMKAMAKLKWEVAEPLLDEMWQCVQIIPDPSRKNIVRPLIDEDIEEVTTRIKLRTQVWKLHTGFLKAVAPSALQGSPVLAASQNDSSNT